MRERKKNRLHDFDYSQNGACFVTICTRNEQKIFWNDYKSSNIRPYDFNYNWSNETMSIETNRLSYPAAFIS